MNAALLLIEMQNDYFAEGRMPLEKSFDAAQKAQEVLQIFRAKHLPIVHMQHISTRPDAIHFLPCTKGVEFYSSVQPLKNETIIKKHYPNSFKDTGLLNYLHKHNIHHLIITGMMTHLSIDATVRAGYDLGFTCTVLHDACAAKNLNFNNAVIPAQNVHHAFIAALQPLYANTMSVKEFLQFAAGSNMIVGA